MVLAMCASIVLPGLGQQYLGDNTKALAYYSAEALFIVGAVFCSHYSRTVFDNAKAFAWDHAEAQGGAGANDQYWQNVADYDESDGYNQSLSLGTTRRLNSSTEARPRTTLRLICNGTGMIRPTGRFTAACCSSQWAGRWRRRFLSGQWFSTGWCRSSTPALRRGTWRRSRFRRCNSFPATIRAPGPPVSRSRQDSRLPFQKRMPRLETCADRSAPATGVRSTGQDEGVRRMFREGNQR